jgi:predicted 3-demethylubiquinone-9 3-methyltransferase (glyoxalase superfamily)
MQKITPHLWFDKEAVQAAGFFVSVYPNSRIKKSTMLHNTPSGTVELVTVELFGQELALLSAGPYFKFNPAISFLIGCKTKEEVEALWAKMNKGGTALMELGEYPFSQKYGWLMDRYGISWQIMFMGEGEIKQKITPTLMFVGDVCGKTEEAINFYTSVFNKSKIGELLRYGKNEGPDQEGTVKHAAFTLAGQEFAAMDSAHKHNFTFNEAISFIIHCEHQEEIDYFWEKLSADPTAEQCGWLKDKYGVSWQIVPTVLSRMLEDNDAKKVIRVTEAFLKMKKFDIGALKKAYQ